MTGKFLLDAMADVHDGYILEAGKEMVQKPMQKKKKGLWKVLLAAALIPLLTVTAFAADVLNIRSLCSGTQHYSSSDFRKLDRAMDVAGLRLEPVERFSNGYVFEKVTVQDTKGLDEHDREVLKYREINLDYRNGDGHRLHLSAEPVLEEISASDRPADQSRGIGGITVEYRLDHYKCVPADYKLTPEDEAWQQIPGNYISYGTDRVEENDVSSVSWEKDGVLYLLMDLDTKETPETLYAMAKEWIDG